jgi:large subunit ribosomal protein L21
MYAILQHGGHQYRVASGDRIMVDRLAAPVGEVIGLAPVLLVSDGDRLETDGAGLDGVRVAATVVAHRRGRKLRVFTYKPKKRHRRTLGFRAELTELVVEGVLSAGEALPEPRQHLVAPLEVAPAERAAAPASAAAPARGRGRRAAARVEAEAEEGQPADDVGEPAGEPPTTAKPRRQARQTAAARVEEETPAPQPAADGGASPGRRRRPRTAATEAASSDEEVPAAPAEGAPPRAARRRVSRREEPTADQVE